MANCVCDNHDVHTLMRHLLGLLKPKEQLLPDGLGRKEPHLTPWHGIQNRCLTTDWTCQVLGKTSLLENIIGW
jgi:hypothetical protein